MIDRSDRSGDTSLLDSAGVDLRLQADRRDVLVLGIGSILVSRTRATFAQTATDAIRRVAVFVPSTRAKEDLTLKPFFVEMRRLGWIEGRNIAYDWVLGNDQLDQLPRLAAKLVQRNPELIYAPPSFPAVAAKRLTNTIPIVFGAVSDPVAVGLVTNLAHPGGNVTGVASITGSLAPKRIELLREVLPGVRRIGMVNDPRDASGNVDSAAMRSATQSLGLELFEAEMLSAGDVDMVFRLLARNRVDAVLPNQFTLGYNLRSILVDAALRARLPLIGPRTEFSEEGALLSYSSSQNDQLTRSAQLVDKILRGARPGDIPIEQPTIFELVVNLRTAKMLGIHVPQSILLRADRVIE